MVSKKFGRRPEFEAMESLVLLSSVSIVGQPGVAALFARKTHQSGPIVLTGKAEGTYRMESGLGAPIHFTGTGNIHPVGLRTHIEGSLQLAPMGYTGSAILRTARGAVVTSLSTSGSGSLLLLTVTGGSGHFAGASGQGEATFTTTPGHNPALGRFTITFINPTS